MPLFPFEVIIFVDGPKVALRHGDLILMEGWTQKYYQHRVPEPNGTKTLPRNVKRGSVPTEGQTRINLTWRWMEDDKSKSRESAPQGPTNAEASKGNVGGTAENGPPQASGSSEYLQKAAAWFFGASWAQGNKL